MRVVCHDHGRCDSSRHHRSHITVVMAETIPKSEVDWTETAKLDLVAVIFDMRRPKGMQLCRASQATCSPAANRFVGNLGCSPPLYNKFQEYRSLSQRQSISFHNVQHTFLFCVADYRQSVFNSVGKPHSVSEHIPARNCNRGGDAPARFKMAYQQSCTTWRGSWPDLARSRRAQD